jgi:hypothetical protein
MATLIATEEFTLTPVVNHGPRPAAVYTESSISNGVKITTKYTASPVIQCIADCFEIMRKTWWKKRMPEKSFLFFYINELASQAKCFNELEMKCSLTILT